MGYSNDPHATQSDGTLEEVPREELERLRRGAAALEHLANGTLEARHLEGLTLGALTRRAYERRAGVLLAASRSGVLMGYGQAPIDFDDEGEALGA